MKRFDHPKEFLEHADEIRRRGEVPEGSRRWVQVINTVSAAEGLAEPLPEGLFDGSEDEEWSFHAGVYRREG